MKNYLSVIPLSLMDTSMCLGVNKFHAQHRKYGSSVEHSSIAERHTGKGKHTSVTTIVEYSVLDVCVQGEFLHLQRIQLCQKNLPAMLIGVYPKRILS